MADRSTRRRFLQTTAAAGATLGAGDLAAFASLSPATLAETEVTPDIARYSPDIEGTVRLLEDTPIEKCPEMLAEQLRGGVPYRYLFAALFLAALRGPSSIAHSVFVIHSAHELSLDARHEERLLPLFWALNSYKHWYNWHAKNPNRLRPFKGTLPPVEKSRAAFHAAMDQADAEGAEAAMLALLRTEGAARVMEMLWPYAAKDCVDIGHNSIAVASTWRALPTVGRQHAEPILRWALSRLVSRGDQTYLPNRERARQSASSLAGDWTANRGDTEFTLELLGLMRDLKAEEACDRAVAALIAGEAQAGAVWDAVHLHAGEIMMRKPDDSHPLHANTAANALHFAFRSSHTPADRLLILLQAIGWQCQHRRRKMETDPVWRASALKIEELAGSAITAKPFEVVEQITYTLSHQPHEAARQVFSYAQQHPDGQMFQQMARSLVIAKSSVNAHDIKYPVAIFEDVQHVSPMWRPYMLAASVYWMPGSDKPDSSVTQQARDAMRKS